MGCIISGTGSSLPSQKIKNEYFENFDFFGKDGIRVQKSGKEIVEKLAVISGINERRFIGENETSADLLLEAAQLALKDAKLTPNDLDAIIVAHNAGNMLAGKGSNFQTVPNLAAILKNKLVVDKYECVAYDILFGCPGWVQASIQANRLIAAKEAKHVLVCGLEVASRLLDPHDMDSMLMGDGCGATIFSENEHHHTGIISSTTFSHAQDDLDSIGMGRSLNPSAGDELLFKMDGKRVYRYATTWLPAVIKKTLEKANVTPHDIDLFFFHQANSKMLKVIAHNLMKLYGQEKEEYAYKIPLSLDFLGNTSVATVPTLLDLVRKQQLDGFEMVKGQKYIFASVGAGMHCNAIFYQN